MAAGEAGAGCSTCPSGLSSGPPSSSGQSPVLANSAVRVAARTAALRWGRRPSGEGSLVMAVSYCRLTAGSKGASSAPLSAPVQGSGEGDVRRWAGRARACGDGASAGCCPPRPLLRRTRRTPQALQSVLGPAGPSRHCGVRVVWQIVQDLGPPSLPLGDAGAV
eukprot:CAMPEP_0206148100 /NCGR_PEP_ID=MMETSP1473-20131121/35556_1 /ASSEMBLY_ACC=CAM_ASM_001109 /TAXON_ID=1461547 /ORGANISM="Stichococcus sp, Strain RCC1054" /LENGTH=163 /DNA_ID=CAMNT_0053545301 /DNA_START=89 /DNA_END=580 /DNA_ORIENTATION=-